MTHGRRVNGGVRTYTPVPLEVPTVSLFLVWAARRFLVVFVSPTFLFRSLYPGRTGTWNSYRVGVRSGIYCPNPSTRPTLHTGSSLPVPPAHRGNVGGWTGDRVGGPRDPSAGGVIRKGEYPRSLPSHVGPPLGRNGSGAVTVVTGRPLSTRPTPTRPGLGLSTVKSLSSRPDLGSGVRGHQKRTK